MENGRKLASGQLLFPALQSPSHGALPLHLFCSGNYKWTVYFAEGGGEMPFPSPPTLKYSPWSYCNIAAPPPQFQNYFSPPVILLPRSLGSVSPPCFPYSDKEAPPTPCCPAPSPRPHTVGCTHSELCAGGVGDHLCGKLELLDLVADQLVPLPATLVPLKLVMQDRGAVVRGSIPAEGQHGFGPI